METVFLVDDDAAVRRSLTRAMREHGWALEAFDSAEAFLAQSNPDAFGCLILDVNMPGLDGLQLQDELSRRGRRLPIVFLSGHGDIPMSVRAIKAGAADFLTKPVSSEALGRAIRSALADHQTRSEEGAELSSIKARLATLTAREREVLAGMIKGRLNKQIAGDLGIVEQTVKFHRARIMERMHAHTVAELMHMAVRLGI